ncbi:hypothetical protein GCM10011610_68080 [Nocardia rhizosphaerihabitans]|uniref:Uncharacterized protein n=1 Tax=Nocardia rhizosphaerihabitans TaxID=1691570 RepID=A0ABQ2L2F2_9NOCA|nr:hypothetical protein GCM10011610_68080 [Nocardia rhizosphaerihabitans]
MGAAEADHEVLDRLLTLIENGYREQTTSSRDLCDPALRWPHIRHLRPEIYRTEDQAKAAP